MVKEGQDGVKGSPHTECLNACMSSFFLVVEINLMSIVPVSRENAGYKNIEYEKYEIQE